MAATILGCACVLSGCGGSGSSTSEGFDAGRTSSAGPGIGAGLSASGLVRCVAGVAGEPVNGDAVTLSLYAESGFGAVVAQGRGALQDAIDLALLRNHQGTDTTRASVAATERAWRRQALAALRHPARAPAVCPKRGTRLPVLAPTEVVCSDQLLIPLGHPAAAAQFAAVLSKLIGATYSLPYVRRIIYGRGDFSYQVVPGSVSERRPYC